MPVSATRAAIEEGIVAGGGSALIHAAAALDGDLGLSGDERSGVGIVRRSLAEPLRWIAENGGEQGYVVTAKVAELKPGNGFNAATGEYGDLIGAGVIDPVKVTRSALANAASIASLLLTTETLVVRSRRRRRRRRRDTVNRTDRGEADRPVGSTARRGPSITEGPRSASRPVPSAASRADVRALMASRDRPAIEPLHSRAQGSLGRYEFLPRRTIRSQISPEPHAKVSPRFSR
jgi:hypothetical protein